MEKRKRRTDRQFVRKGETMIYRNFQEIKLSGLGMGAMRLPVIDGGDSRIDETKTQAMVDYAMEQGVNYYDTAWGCLLYTSPSPRD